MNIPKKKILVIDDDPEDLSLVGEILRETDCEFHTSLGAVDGLAKAIEWKPDLIILDLMLPSMSGFGFIRELRSRSLKIPILVLTGIHDDEIELVSRDLGANGYLVKDHIDRDLIPMIYEYAA